MGFLNRILGKQRDRPLSEADDLVDMIHIMVLPAYQPYLEEVPKLARVTPEQFDFFMTSAGVCCALIGLEIHRPGTEYERARRAAERRLSARWGGDGAKAVLDCNQFVARSLSGPDEVSGPDALPAALGMWIVWNLFQEEPGDGDLKLVSMTGKMAVALSSAWWAVGADSSVSPEQDLASQKEPDPNHLQQATKSTGKGSTALDEVRQMMLDGLVAQNALKLEDPSPVGTLDERPEPLRDVIAPEEYPDSDIMALLARLGSHRAKRIVTSLEARISAEDWAQNALALCYGSPGSLKAAVIKRDRFFAEAGFRAWDTELLDLVGELLQIGSDAADLQYLYMQAPQRLKQACEQFLAHQDS